MQQEKTDPEDRGVRSNMEQRFMGQRRQIVHTDQERII